MLNDAAGTPAELPDEIEPAAEELDGLRDAPSFPVVGVGASAGGLEAFTQLLKALPADTGMAFVLVQHLAPTHPSALAEILSRSTRMPVKEARSESAVERNHVYVIPPDRSMIIVRGMLRLLPREGPGVHRPIDQFFRSLAEEQRHRAIGVVLSGTANDGTTGLEAIKAEGGITFAQDSTAHHEGMPHSAIESGCVDFVLSPEAIAGELVRIGRHPYATTEAVPPDAGDQPDLARVVQALRLATGVDFSHYKLNTLYRRVTRRMVFQKHNNMADYVQYLQRTPGEADALFQDILIGVTSFFRDPDAFEALKLEVFPKLLAGRSRHEPIRLWSVGCSTGQEAYSLAMAFTEVAEATGSPVRFQLFATDLNPASVEKARAGVYTKDIAQDVSPERLRRFFTEVNGGYRISKQLRDACVFSRHNMLTDPPFSRIDLIACRNLLIYMEPTLQKVLVPRLHYALQPGGFLWLGSSESVGGYRALFDPVDAKHRMYMKRPGSAADLRRAPLKQGEAPRFPAAPSAAYLVGSGDLPREADRILLGKFAPPGVLVSAELDILQFRGDTSPFLTPAPGKASLSLPKMLRAGLLVAVRTAVAKSIKDTAPVRVEGVRVTSPTGELVVALDVIPVKAHGMHEVGFLVLFEEHPKPSPRRPSAAAAGGGVLSVQPESTDAENALLLQQLSATREYLQALTEQQEAANEELQSANEEIQSANEELQSTNEELETSKEEIQSSNEELATVNDELNNRNTELSRVNNDLLNLLDSVQMPIIMLGPDLRVRRFTPVAEKLLHLIPSDVGRPLADIKLNLQDLPDLEPHLVHVLETVTTHEFDIRDRNGRWYLLRLRPYRTHDNRIDGVVVVFVDVSDRKRAESIVKSQNERLQLLGEAAGSLLSAGDPGIMLRGLLAKSGIALGVDTYLDHLADDSGEVLRLVSSDGITAEEAGSLAGLDPAQDFFAAAARQRRPAHATRIQGSDDPKLARLKALGFRAFFCSPLLSDQLLLGTLSFGSRTQDEFDADVLAVMQTLSRYVVMTHERSRLVSMLRDADRRKDEFLAMLAHELRGPLAPISNSLTLIQKSGSANASVADASLLMRRQLGHLVRLVDDLLDVSRIRQGKIELRMERLDLVLAVNQAVDDVRPLFEAMQHELTVAVPSQPLYLDADPTRLAQVLDNLLNNACKYTNRGGHISITAERDGLMAVIRVRDDGIGIKAEHLGSIFDLFVQVDTSPEFSGSGLGLGLTLVKNLVELHGGTVEGRSAGEGRGSEFIVRLPVAAQTPDPVTAPDGLEPSTPAHRRVLIVDDNVDSAASMAMLLELSGYETSIAHDGLEGLAAAESQRPDIMLLDLGLPNLNGYETARRIRERPWGKSVVLIAVTGWNQDSARRQSRDAGFDEHLVKPVDHGVLLKVLARTSPSTPPPA